MQGWDGAPAGAVVPDDFLFSVLCTHVEANARALADAGAAAPEADLRLLQRCQDFGHSRQYDGVNLT
jgi:hypothetical protein